MRQNEWILEELQRGVHVTPVDALAGCQCFRLAARIAELRDIGHNIHTTMVYSNGKRYASYRLIKLKGKKNGK
jgi:hypothetical protein